MKKKVLSLALALVMCLSLLPTAAMAVGTKKVVTIEKQGVTVTMNEFLREETHRYKVFDRCRAMTIYVVADDSLVTVEAMEGRRYATEAEIDTYWEDEDFRDFAHMDSSSCLGWTGEEDGFGTAIGNVDAPLTEPVTYTVSPSEVPTLQTGTAVNFMCKSDFAQLVPFEGKPMADAWAQETMEKAYDADLFPDGLDPYAENCSRSMTRAEFAAATVYLYAAMQGKSVWSMDLDSSTPFEDVSVSYSISGASAGAFHSYSVTKQLNGSSETIYSTSGEQYMTNEELYAAAGITEEMRNVRYKNEIGYAYNLGIVNGTSATTFSPDNTLTREQAAVMLARVYSKLHGDIPTVTATSFADDGAVSGWAKSGVAFMADKGIVGGVGGNQFAPQQTLSIQEAMTMAVRMLENLK